tara:strand:- start:70 stop:729 length:660 start_codon:yes stop_codon:yes gene_type:complete
MVLEFITGIFESIINSVPEQYRVLMNLGFYTVFISIYAVFIWKFYKFLASREILSLNLRQYNRSQHPGLEKLFAVLFFSLEYMIILPFLVLFWFAILSLFLLLLSDVAPAQVLLISAAIIASTRITAYIGEDLAKDLAKMFPFAVLAIFLLKPEFFNTLNFINKIGQIPELFSNIVFFIIFIFGVEFILRGIYSIAQLIGSKSGSEEEGEETQSPNLKV